MTAVRSLLRDWLLPLALAAVTVLDVVANGHDVFPSPLPLVAGMLAGAALVLGFRRAHPAPTAVAASAAVTAYMFVLHRDLAQQPAIEPFLVLLVAYFALGQHADRRQLVLGATASAALVGAAEAASLLAGRPLGDVVPSLLFWTTAGLLGRLLRHHRREARLERERATRAEQERDLHARHAATEERTRIARELHDVIAHSLSVIVIQASVEARLLEEQDSSTARTLRTIEDTGREALAELRRLLGLLRTDEHEAVWTQPLPSLKNLDALLDQIRDTGVDVDLRVTGERQEIPAGVDLSAYRIAQEALTNTLKHAPGSSVQICVDYQPDSVTVHVEDDGGSGAPGRPAGAGLATAGGGHGLVGMQERVKLYDGTLEAGPRRTGGFRIRALIPTRRGGR